MFVKETKEQSECVALAKQSWTRVRPPCSDNQGTRVTWKIMKHGGTVTALSLVLAFAHRLRLCAPFSSVAPRQSSRAQPSQAGTHRTAWALEAATTSETMARREDMLQAKRAAKDKLVAQRVSVWCVVLASFLGWSVV